MLCGFTLGDYIRMRRLALAAEDLMRTDDKVIDIAYRYGYDTPESFSRAFTRFHGVTPTQARHGRSVKSFSRLSVKLILSGGTTMMQWAGVTEQELVIGQSSFTGEGNIQREFVVALYSFSTDTTAGGRASLRMVPLVFGVLSCSTPFTS